MADIHLQIQNDVFKLRVAGIINYKNKYLLIKHQYNNFWCLPGGHVEIGETTEDAIKREIKEETNTDVSIIKLLNVDQNFYQKNDKNYHEICFYYLLSPLNPSTLPTNQTITENDPNKGLTTHTFNWYTKEEIKLLNVNPYITKTILDNKTTTFTSNKN